MYKFIVGADMSKDKFDVSYSCAGEFIYLGVFANDTAGFKQLEESLKTKTEEIQSKWFVCFENTGVYSKHFLQWLIKNNIACLEENPIQISRSMGLRRGKSDKIDSKAICKYAYEKRDLLKTSKLPTKGIEKLRKIITRRKLLDKHRSSLRVSLSESKSTTDQELYEFMKRSNDELVGQLNEQIKQLDFMINDIMKTDQKIRTNAELCQSVVGIGPITAAVLLIRTNNFEDIKDGRKLSCYCGTAPFSNSSGKFTGRSKVSHFGDKYLKSLLSNGAQNAIRFDKEIKQYYNRKIKEGKAYGTVINAVKNKILHRVCAVVRRKQPYVRLMQYA